MGGNYFFTGFPGFIASSLIRELIKQGYEAERINLLVLPDMVSKAAEEVKAIASSAKVSTDLFSILPGDITKPELGLAKDQLAELSSSITHVFHLAAIYDLAVPRDIAYRVNVKGTENVNAWVLTLNKLQRYIYFSTAYVSGTRQGRILESELDMGQTFKNHYESTKYEAELLVRGTMDRAPVTIIRPGIVKGDSRTGETVKFDGPYFILNFLDKLRFLPIIPYMGSGEAEGNFVPVDYIFNATLYLAHSDKGVGQTYHLTDPKPFQMKEVFTMLCQELLGRKPKGRIPLSTAKFMMSFAWIRKWLRVEREGLDYFSCLAVYDSSQAQRDLAGSGISCPDFNTCLKPMVSFYEEHKNDLDRQLKIN